MKKYKIYFLAFMAFAGLVSCEENYTDPLVGQEDAGGVLTSATSSLTYALGATEGDFEYTADVSIYQGSVQTTKVDVYKQFVKTDGDAETPDLYSENILLTTITFPGVVGEMEHTSYNFTYLQLIEGLTIDGVPVPTDDSLLLAGDQFILTYVSHTSTGHEHLNGDIQTKVNIACVSVLEGMYSTSTLRVSNNAVYTFAEEEFTQVADGQYLTSYVGPYYCGGQMPGSANTIQLPAGTNAGYVFTDICGQLVLETQNLANAYTNEVRQSAAQREASFVDYATGVVTIHYSVFFTSNTVEREFISTYTPID
jgi:hypothetical protein